MYRYASDQTWILSNNVDPMFAFTLEQRRICWPNIKTTPGQTLRFKVKQPHIACAFPTLWLETGVYHIFVKEHALRAVGSYWYAWQ